MQKTITLIAAMGKNREIGLDGRMPWHLPAELQHFKQTTMDKAIVMGRKTWQAIVRILSLQGTRSFGLSVPMSAHPWGLPLMYQAAGKSW